MQVKKGKARRRSITGYPKVGTGGERRRSKTANHHVIEILKPNERRAKNKTKQLERKRENKLTSLFTVRSSEST
jgi:hypothetical protein